MTFSPLALLAVALITIVLVTGFLYLIAGRHD